MAMASVRGPDAFSVAVWTFLSQLHICMVSAVGVTIPAREGRQVGTY